MWQRGGRHGIISLFALSLGPTPKQGPRYISTLITGYRTLPGLAWAWPWWLLPGLALFFAYRLLPPTFSLYHRHHIAQLSNEHHMHAIDDNDDYDDVDGSLFLSLSPAHSLAAPSHHPPRPAHRKPYPTDSATSSTPRRRVRSAIDW